MKIFDPGQRRPLVERQRVGMNGRIRYLLGAGGGQLMTVMLASADSNVGIEVRGPNGLIKDVGMGDRAMAGDFAGQRDYAVDGIGLLGARAYTVTFTITTP
ncbi:MAG: hypothetical protein R2856_26530 [Caldilineaceae bacterium]